MAANQAMMDSRPADQAMETVAQMEASGAKGDWGRVDQLAVRLRHLVLEVPEDERQAVIVSIGHCLDRLKVKALAAHRELSEKLTDIRRGRVANRAYGQPERRAPDSPLR